VPTRHSRSEPMELPKTGRSQHAVRERSDEWTQVHGHKTFGSSDSRTCVVPRHGAAPADDQSLKSPGTPFESLEQTDKTEDQEEGIAVSQTHVPKPLEKLRTSIQRHFIENKLHEKNIDVEMEFRKKLEGKPLLDYHGILWCTIHAGDTFSTDITYGYCGYLDEPLDFENLPADLESKLPADREFETDFDTTEQENILADVWKVFQLLLSELRHHYETTKHPEERVSCRIDVDLNSGSVVLRGPRGTQRYSLAELPAQ